MSSYVHVYTGNGKGKTTAAIGLAIRAVGAGKKVLFTQFVKGMKYSEIEALERFYDKITIKQFGRGCFIVRDAAPEDIECAQQGLKEVGEDLSDGKYDLIILDEACIALYYKLFTVAELIDVVKQRHEHVEVVITGRYAPDELVEYADLVTEMREVKHYYTKGVDARDGIER
ncbi:MAG TPA: cob(I)yrinic acid a,c-diamide adenosyltransferase [Chitinispirillaceae bacterium]|nr:cob(I)yrinic acid a,c-diamide adenosyltransferase [Chitinispirillaceae bacterium]